MKFKPDADEIVHMGGLIEPWGRAPKPKSRKGNDDPQYKKISDHEIIRIESGFDASIMLNTPHLWIINNTGIYITDSKNDTIKHTNITGGGQAIQGGEISYDGESILVNTKSGRYNNASIECICYLMKWMTTNALPTYKVIFNDKHHDISVRKCEECEHREKHKWI